MYAIISGLSVSSASEQASAAQRTSLNSCWPTVASYDTLVVVKLWHLTNLGAHHAWQSAFASWPPAIGFIVPFPRPLTLAVGNEKGRPALERRHPVLIHSCRPFWQFSASTVRKSGALRTLTIIKCWLWPAEKATSSTGFAWTSVSQLGAGKENRTSRHNLSKKKMTLTTSTSARLLLQRETCSAHH